MSQTGPDGAARSGGDEPQEIDVSDVDEALSSAPEVHNTHAAPARQEPAAPQSSERLETLELGEQSVTVLQRSWDSFVRSETFYDAAELLYSTFSSFDPSMAEMFKTPRVSMGPKMLDGLTQLIEAVGNKALLQSRLEVLAFRHMDLAIDMHRITLLAKAALDMLMKQLGATMFGDDEVEAWTAFLTYVGRTLLTLKAVFVDRIALLTSSWASANSGKAKTQQQMGAEEKEPDDELAMMENAGAQKGSGSVQNSKKAMAGMKIPETVSEMFMFNAAVMGQSGKTWMPAMLESFETLVTHAESSHRVQEEIDVLALQLSKFSDVHPQSFGSVMIASLRALLPRVWSSNHELAWSWFWQMSSSLLMSRITLPPAQFSRLNSFIGSLSEQQLGPLRRSIYDQFFILAPTGQQYFKQSSARLDSIIDKAVALCLSIYETPKQTFDDLSMLGLRHVGFGSPTSLFGPFVSAAVKVFDTYTQEFDTQEAVRWSLSLVSRVLVRVITEGSSPVMQAINGNSSSRLRLSVSQVGRGQRAASLLKLQVGAHSISPLMWALEAGSFEAAKAIIVDLLTIRADRDRYYYGVDEIFERHPDIVQVLCSKAPAILPTFLDLLIWRSNQTNNGMRRVNYFIKHLLVDADGNIAQALACIAAQGDPALTCNPTAIIISELAWKNVAAPVFMVGRSWLLLTLIIFCIAQSLPMEGDQPAQYVTFACRLFIYTTCLLRYLMTHAFKSVKDYRSRNVFWVWRLPVPNYLKTSEDLLNLVLTLALTVDCLIDSIWYCMDAGFEDPVLGQFTELCPEQLDAHFYYSLTSLMTVLFYFSMLMRLSVLNMRLSAFVLVSYRMFQEVAIFVFSETFMVIAFACGLGCLDHSNDDFMGNKKSMVSLTLVFFGFYPNQNYQNLLNDPALLFFVGLFCLVSLIFLTNMLIGQITVVYSSSFQNMVGLARLSRMQVVVENLPSAPRRMWMKFVASQKFDERIEFNEGDLGLAGGVQVLELPSANPTFIDIIERFGGLTSLDTPWPEAVEEEKEDQFKALESMLMQIKGLLEPRDETGSSVDMGSPTTSW